MRVLYDYEGRSVSLTDERLAHIQEHPEMVGMAEKIEQTLKAPERVIESLSDPEARLYYRFYFGTPMGGKFSASWSKPQSERPSFSPRI